MRLSELVEPIRALFKDKVPFNWDSEHQEAFQQMKKEIARAPILACYNPRKQTVLQTDTRIKGLDACLLQGKKPVYFASKALSEVQKGYVAIEIESLFSCMGHGEVPPLLVCKPLYIGNRPEAIRSYTIQKPQPSNSKATKNSNKNLSISLHCPLYIPGVTNQLADCLLRLGGQKDTITLPKLHLYQITHQLSARIDSLNQLRVSTQADNELALLKCSIMLGWPSSIKQVPPVLQPYWTFREELTVEDGLILKGIRIVIPAKKHEAILKLICEGYLGLNKCKLHAKETVCWPGLNDQLEKLVLNCESCLKYSHSKCKEEPCLSLGWEVPLYPWTKLATDIFYFEGACYLLVVNYTSRFPVVHKLTSMTS